MSTTVLPQLEEIASALAAQEADLTAQLNAVQEKLNGIRAVLPMFDGATTTAATSPTASATAAVAPDTAESDAPELPKKTTKAKTQKTAVKKTATKKAAPEKVTAEKTTAEKTTTKKTATKAKSSKASSKKPDGRAADWQKYARPGVKNQSIPDAVKLVLATQPKKDFKIAEVMEALFKDMPKAQYLKARNRVSNVLSGGARAGDWQRGDHSTYRMEAT